MNIDINVANRALSRVGQERLVAGTTTGRAYELINKFYCVTIVEALSTVPWTSAKRRAALLLDTVTPNLTTYAYSYALPVDCAMPLELQENDYFIVEGLHLFTNTAAAILLYISNGRLEPVGYLTSETYPEYSLPNLEPKFWEYIETKIASKIALELTAKPELYQTLFNEAALIGQEASKTSRTASAAKIKASTPWFERIGVSHCL